MHWPCWSCSCIYNFRVFFIPRGSWPFASFWLVFSRLEPPWQDAASCGFRITSKWSKAVIFGRARYLRKTQNFWQLTTYWRLAYTSVRFICIYDLRVLIVMPIKITTVKDSDCVPVTPASVQYRGISECIGHVEVAVAFTIFVFFYTARLLAICFVLASF